MNKQQQSSTLVMALAIIAATMLVSTVIVEALDLFDDAEAKKKSKRRHRADTILPDTTWIPISLLTNDIQKQLV
jgi:hypothetical protein